MEKISTSRVPFVHVHGEELPMTIQVGMVGTDGLLLVGDTRWTNEPTLINRDWAAGRFGFNSTKLKISHERGMAVACARNMETATRIANEVLSNLRTEDFEYPILPIEAMGAKVLSTAGDRNNAQALIALIHPEPQLFLFQFGSLNREWGAYCQKMDTIAIAGDNLNAAIFWAERYYQSLPVEKLIPLAAQVVVSAKKLNTGTIGGLEGIVCNRTGIHRLSPHSILELERKASELDVAIGDMFLNHQQQFTYVPNVVS